MADKSKETKTETVDYIHESNSFVTTGIGYLGSSIMLTLMNDFSNKETVKQVVNDPITNHDMAVELSRLVYNKNGIVSGAIDYMVSLPFLDNVIVSKSSTLKKRKTNKKLMKKALKKIDHKSFIRNCLFTEMIEGEFYYYCEVIAGKKKTSNKKYFSDTEIYAIDEINETTNKDDFSIVMIQLPYEYTKIIGKKNGRYVLAFNLSYFDRWENKIAEQLLKFPKEIRDAYNNKARNGNWVVLDNDKTLCRKIKCKDTEIHGRPISISALDNVIYKEDFISTKRQVLSDVANKVIYETFPMGERQGSCALTKGQQEEQHKVVKQAMTSKNSKGGISFVSLSAGTKLDSIDTSTDIFDEKNESNLSNDIALDVGVSASLLGSSSSATYSTQENNLKMITSQLYSWIWEIQEDLNHVINKNIIKDSEETLVYYFPTTFVNKDKYFDMMKSLYTDAGGSLEFLLCSTGIDSEMYLSILNDEIEEGIFEKYKPHATSWTLSNRDGISGNNGGTKVKTKTVIDNPTNENTIISKSYNGNDIPSPSD